MTPTKPTMSLFPSWEIMIAIDVLLILMGVAITVLLVRNTLLVRRTDGRSGSAFASSTGLYVLLIGYWVFASSHIYDLYTMAVLPSLVGLEAAMAEMMRLHLNYAWYANTCSGILAVGGVVMVMRTFLRQERSLRLAREKAEAANLAKSGFLASMSHEIRTPMNGVLGMVHVLSMSDMTADQRANVDTIREAAGSMVDILNEILDLSKIEAGAIVLEPSDFSIAHLLASADALWAPQADARGISFRVRNLLGDTDVIRSDRGRLRQVIHNLIGNALKFTEEGEIEVRVSPLARGDGTLGLRFEVRDTGIGLSDQQREFLFEPFVQADESIARRFGGTGLGLAISRKLVEALGGEIGVDGAPGGGSTFWFTITAHPGDPAAVRAPCGAAPETADTEAVALPAAATASTAPTRDTSGDRPAAGRETGGDECAGGENGGDQNGGADGLRVLIAEDNEINRKVVTLMLANSGCAIDLVENGREAVDAVAGGSYDVVLMDIQMPVMDGVAATREIRTLPETDGGIPIVAMTANAMQGDREKFLDAGMDDYIAKPLDRRGLLDTLERVTGRTLPDRSEAA